MHYRDGILTKTLRLANGDELGQQHWVVFDGPLEPFWPKLMSTLLDESRMLLLPTGHMLAIPNRVSPPRLPPFVYGILGFQPAIYCNGQAHLNTT